MRSVSPSVVLKMQLLKFLHSVGEYSRIDLDPLVFDMQFGGHKRN